MMISNSAMKKLAAAALLLVALSGCIPGSKPQDEVRVLFVPDCGGLKSLLPLLTQGWIVMSSHPVPASENGSQSEKVSGSYVLLKKEYK